MTGIATVKGHTGRPVEGVEGEVTWKTEDPDEMLPWSIRIAGRYVEAEYGEAYGRRNAVPARCWCASPPRTWAAQKAISD